MLSSVLGHLIELDANGVGSVGDPHIGFLGKSEFSAKVDQFRTEGLSDAAELETIPHRLKVAKFAAATRLEMFAKSQGLTQGALAARLGVSQTAMSSYFSRMAAIPYRTYEDLAILERVTDLKAWIVLNHSDLVDKFEDAARAECTDALPEIAKVVRAVEKVFGDMGWQDFRDWQGGSFTPIPPFDESPEGLAMQVSLGRRDLTKALGEHDLFQLRILAKDPRLTPEDQKRALEAAAE